MNGLLVPGPSTLTIAVKDCRGQAQTSTSITFTPIATDEQFHMLGLEATQVVQNIPSSVPLVANKPTFVRVYLRVSGGTPSITGVRGTLVAYRPANSSATSVCRSPAASNPRMPSRSTTRSTSRPGAASSLRA